MTLTARAFVQLIDATGRLSRRRAWALSIALMAATVVLDHMTGTVVSLSFLYMLTTAVAVWCLGERGGLALGVAAAVAGAVYRHFDMAGSAFGGHVIGIGTEVWNTFARILSIGLVAVIAHGLHCALQLERWRASHDGLTGALNKAAFRQQAEALVQRARMQGRALVLAYMDLDGFKGVNDRHGHSAGDRVLRAFASAASGTIRDADLFARIGGDEFVALMAVRTCEEGDQVAEMLHGRLTAILRETGFKVTCSMGALVSRADAFDLDDEGLELADMLMYEVKRSGKDALRIARGGELGTRLRSAYPPIADDGLGDLLAQIDLAGSDEMLTGDRRVTA